MSSKHCAAALLVLWLLVHPIERRYLRAKAALASLLLGLFGCGGTVGKNAPGGWPSPDLPVDIEPATPTPPPEYGGGDTRNGVPPSLEQRQNGSIPVAVDPMPR